MGCVVSANRPQRTITLEDYLKEARTGDVVLFESDGFEARLVQCATGSRYSHVAMVIVIDPVPRDIGGSGVYLWHAPSSALRSLPDLLYDPPRAKDGPQLNDLPTALNLFRNVKEIDVRRFTVAQGTTHPWGAPSVGPDDALVKFIRKEHGKHYESNLIELVKSAEDTFTSKNTTNLREYFCSELVAETFKEFGIMLTEEASNEFTPRNFSKVETGLLGLAPFVRLRTEARISFGA
jgi:hypothetical protein